MRAPGGRGRRAAFMVTAAVVAAAVLAAVLVVVLRDDRGGGADARVRAEAVLDARQLALIRAAKPGPRCEDATRTGPVPAADAGLVPLDVMRVDGSCLSVATEYVAPGDVEARRAVLARDPAVVVAAVAPPMTPHALSPAAAPAPSALSSPSTQVAPAAPTQEDDRRGDQWPLDLLGAPENSADLPWPDGTGVVVAVIDTGVDAGHPDLAGAVVGRRHYEGEGALDEEGHGTHVAGIVAARRGNGGIVGVAPGVSVLDVPVHLKKANPRGPSWWTGLTWAVNHGADVANMSFGGAYSLYQLPEYRDALAFGAAAVEFARAGGVVLVGSAGNCGERFAGNPFDNDCEDRHQRQVPSVYDGVVNVGAVNDDREVMAYSSKNDDVDLVAPGGQQTALLPPGHGGGLVLSLAPGGKYAGLQGTSQAAPHVAAAAAVARFVRPDATAEEVSRALVDTADPGGVDEDDRGKRGTGRGMLNIAGLVDRIRNGPPPGPTSAPTAGQSPGPSGSPGAPVALAERTQAAYVQDGTLYAYDGATSHPVRAADRPPGWLAWSADHTLLVGADERTLFSWAGPGTKPVEKPCDDCAGGSGGSGPPALVQDAAVTDPGGGPPTGDLVLRMDVDGTLTRYNAHTLDEIGSSVPAFPADAVGSKSLRGPVGGRLLVHESGGAQASERLWLVDPVSGQVGPSHDVAGSVVGTVATSAAGDKVAVATGYGSCGSPQGVYVLRGSDLGEVARPAPPAGVMFDEMFFNGDILYAAMARYAMPPGEPCARTGSAGLWRFAGGAWERVDAAVAAGRPLEGRSPGAAPAAPAAATGWLLARDGRAVLEPAAPGDPAKGDLGPLGDRVWATPTRTEVPLKPR
ncbi:S8 family peptidase [Streptodolium elevatio]|uniref:S8 family serine peptidase n=1 Tax=Streptodolium elevatio TaxID=3157996 RepID=A0ABV3DKU7_9ACTN